MSNDNEQKWREDFYLAMSKLTGSSLEGVKVFYSNPKKLFEEELLHESIYLAGRKHSEAVIEQIEKHYKDLITRYNNENHDLMKRIADLEALVETAFDQGHARGFRDHAREIEPVLQKSNTTN